MPTWNDSFFNPPATYHRNGECCKLVGYVKTAEPTPITWPVFKCPHTGFYVDRIVLEPYVFDKSVILYNQDNQDVTYGFNSWYSSDEYKRRNEMFWNTLMDILIEHG